MQQIVDGSGLTKGAFYHHFAGKEAVLGLILVDALEARRSTVERLSAVEGPLPEQLRRIVRALARQTGDGPATAAVVLHERRHLTGAPAEDVHRLQKAVESMLEELVRQGVARGNVDASIDPHSVVLAVLALLDGLQHQLHAGSEAVERVADELARIVVSGIAPERLETSARVRSAGDPGVNARGRRLGA